MANPFLPPVNVSSNSVILKYLDTRPSSSIKTSYLSKFSFGANFLIIGMFICNLVHTHKYRILFFPNNYYYKNI